MTIKPIIKNQKSKDDGSEEQNQNLGGTNSPNREKRKSVGFEENGPRHVRRTPSKSSNRLKRDHHQKRGLEGANVRPGEPYSSVLCPLNVNTSATATASSLGHANSPNAIGSTSAVQVSGPGGELLANEETPSGYNSGDEHQSGRDAGLTEHEWKQRDEEFAKTLAKEGLIVKEIEEDGACLFRSISLQIYGDQDMHEDIRQQTMDYISQNREYFAQFLTEDIAGYISRKRKKNVHGNHIEIQAMSEIYNRPVELYCYKTKPINIFNSEQTNNGYEPLRLSYQRSSHYNAILDPYKASVGVGLGLAGYQPDELDLKQVQTAVRVSEELQIEQTMFEDKLKTTDWEATNEAIEEQIARESYLTWCRENMQRTKKSVSSTVTSQSSATGSSSLFMPGSSSGSSSVTGGPSSSCGIGGGLECNNNNSPSPTLISKATSVDLNINATPTTAIGGRMSPKQQQYQSDDGLKSGSSTCTSISASSSSCSSTGSSSLLGENNNLFDGSIRRRRRRRHNNSKLNVCVQERGSDLPRVNTPEMGGLNLVETRSTDSNDSDCSDETQSKKVKRRLEGAETEEEINKMGLGLEDGAIEKGLLNVAVVNDGEVIVNRSEQELAKEGRHSASSVELTEPGPSKSGPEAQAVVDLVAAADMEATIKEQENFYHSLLESSYIDDGSIQMSEAEMIERAIQMSRIDYISKLQKGYDSP